MSVGAAGGSQTGMLLVFIIFHTAFSTTNTSVTTATTTSTPSCGDFSSLAVGASCQSTWSDLRNVNASAAAAFSGAYAKLVSPTPSAPVASVDDWQVAADTLVYLARGAAAAGYELPSSMGTMAGKLPGYQAGITPINADDPDCDPPRCS